MTSNPPPGFRVALAAAPALLAESLRSLLPRGVEVTLVVEPVVTDGFDLAIVAGDGPTVAACVVLRLDDTPTAQGGGVATFADGRPPLVLADLGEALAFVDHLVADTARTNAG